MTKRIVLSAAIACLLYAVYASWAHFQGYLPRSVFLSQFAYVSVGWFGLATWWAYRR